MKNIFRHRRGGAFLSGYEEFCYVYAIDNINIRVKTRACGFRITIIKNKKESVKMTKKSKKVIVPKMVDVKAEGRRYTMGSTDDPSSDECFFETGFDYDFSIGQFNVTQEEYESLMGNNPSNFKGAKNPVECVSWWDAIKYCNALSRSQGKPVAYNEETGELLDEKGNPTKDLKLVKGYRLPMESEWEYAARGGELSKGYKFAGSDNVDEVAWYNTDHTNPVGLKKPNELGIYDMSGNVWEWCYDKYVKNRNKPDED